MSLSIRIVKVYKSTNKSHGIDCKCKLWIGLDGKKLDKLGKLYSIEKTKKLNKKSLIAYKNASNTNGYLKQEQNELLESEKIRIDQKEDEDYDFATYYFGTNSNKYGYKLEIYCYKSRAFSPFGKFCMLLDSLNEEKRDEFSDESKIVVDDFLVDPKTGSVTDIKICFELYYTDLMHISYLNKLSNKYETKSYNSYDNQSTAFDYIGTLIKAGEFALDHFHLNDDLNQKYNEYFLFNLSRLSFIFSGILLFLSQLAPLLKSNFTHETIKKFIISAGNCSMTLNFALNLIMPFEANTTQKYLFKKSFIKNNPYLDKSQSLFSYQNIKNDQNHLIDLNSHYILNQLFYSEYENEKITSWQVRIRIIEIKNLIGLNETVYCMIDIGDKRFKTKEKYIDNLQFNEDDIVFTARIDNKEFQRAFDYIINISVYFKKYFYSDVLVGCFKTDFGTIYRHPGHEVFHKWGELMAKNQRKLNTSTSSHLSSDHFNYSSYESEFSIKGYVKFDIVLQSTGDQTKLHYEEAIQNENDDIENNFLLPYGLNEPRQFIKIKFNIFSAQILLKFCNNGFFNYLANIFSSKNNNNESNELNETESEFLCDLNPFVKISYAGITKKTISVNSTSNPTWNTSIEFNFFYPPLVNTFKIELCTVTKSGREKTLAKEYLNLNEISNYRQPNTYFPTYGPCFIEMFDKPNSYRLKKVNKNIKPISNQIETENADLDAKKSENGEIYDSIVADGSFYVGRLLIGIDSKRIQSSTDFKNLLRKNYNSKNSLFNQKESANCNASEFLSFLMIDQATMIDPRYKNGNISFKLCLGINGYDGASTKYNQSEPIRPVQLNNDMPIYLPYDKSKPCLSFLFLNQDMRHALFKINFIENTVKMVCENYENLKRTIWNKETNATKLDRANDFYREIVRLVQHAKTYLNCDKKKLTEFERKRCEEILFRFSIICDLLNLILKLVGKFKYSNVNENFKFYIDLIIKNSVLKIRNYLREPFCIFPNLSLWLLFNDKPVGVCNLSANDVIYSKDDLDRGLYCGKLFSTDIKSLIPSDFENPEKEHIARIRLFVWLGLKEERNVISLPNGYEFQQKDQMKNELDLPIKLLTLEPQVFQLNAYLYQARDLLMLDIAGESDPFARITILNQSVQSKTIDNTTNPTWNEALCISQIYLYGKLEEIFTNPPEIIVDIFDEDPFNQKEYMGRFYAKPFMNDGFNPPPKLKWYQLYHDYKQAGDILASFELIYLNDKNQVQPIKEIQLKGMQLLSSFSLNYSNRRNWKPEEIPRSIKPKTRPYTLEICYWGLRNLYRNINDFVSVGQEKITVQIEIGDLKLESNVIEKCSVNANFVQLHQKQIIELPEEDEYKPHLAIKCESYGSLFLYTKLNNLETLEKTLSRKVLIGSCTIRSIGDYCFDNEQLVHFCKKNSNRNLIHSISVYEDPKKAPSNLNKTNQKRINSILKKKEATVKDDVDLDLDYVDWWSKYFASINMKKDEQSMSYNSIVTSDEENKESSTFDDNSDSSSQLDSKSTDASEKILKRPLKRLFKKNQPKKEFINKNKKKTKKIQQIRIFENELENNFKLNETIETFNLVVGKNMTYEKNEATQCQFKGKFMLYDENNLSNELISYLNLNEGFLKKMPPNLPVRVKVNVYIIKTSIISSINLIGKFEPSIFLECGDVQINEKLKIDAIESLIGRCFEFEAKFPNQSQLSISIKNWNILSGHELIGRTVIDLEDRFYSNCYATCGLPKKFELTGYNAWRDNLYPKQILEKMCKKFGLMRPKFTNGKLLITELNGSLIMEFPDTMLNELLGILKTSESNCTDSAIQKSESGDSPIIFYKNFALDKYEEQLALDALNSWHKITKVSLVPEHVETRSMYNPELGSELEQAKVQMWIDMFPINDYKMENMPTPVEVSVRKPKKFQLRVIVYNTKDVILDDTNLITGEKTSDIYVKSYLCDKSNEYQKTDVHYRSLNGEGNFNWRFMFDFDYLPYENRIVYENRADKFSFASTKRNRYKHKPVIRLQCYDEDHLSSDDLLGQIDLNLSKLIMGSKSPENCTLNMIKQKWPTINLFKKRLHRGWWPFITSNGNSSTITGKVDLEFQLLSDKEAEEHPAGLGRNPPDALPDPNRPQTSFLWFTQPFQTFRFIIWKNYWRQIILMIFLLIILIVLIVFFVQLPHTLLNKFLG